ncbi:exodeoxyribonuclease V subunit gamma, partial [Acinetobacter baumannii]|uniref:exodeoxyribonuclease V subunit gamma n=1 Tax=Acinetobacter baumannii TaxID=470 RepID=UPI0018E07007
LVAPLPDLEGSALDALDTLVRLLRVLARYANVLRDALPPAQWRERLLELLQALLPKPPTSPATSTPQRSPGTNGTTVPPSSMTSSGAAISPSRRATRQSRSRGAPFTGRTAPKNPLVIPEMPAMRPKRPITIT